MNWVGVVSVLCMLCPFFKNIIFSKRALKPPNLKKELFFFYFRGQIQRAFQYIVYFSTSSDFRIIQDYSFAVKFQKITTVHYNLLQNLMNDFCPLIVLITAIVNRIMENVF